MSDTPLTDEQVEDHVLENRNHPHTDWVPASFARQLERELNELREEYETMDGNLAHSTGLAKSRLEICRKLRKEKEILERQLREAEDDLSTAWMLGQASNLDELGELRKDKARLDWLDLQDYAEFGDGERGDVTLEVLDDDGFPHHHGKGNARHCIDVAMNAMKGGRNGTDLML